MHGNMNIKLDTHVGVVQPHVAAALTYDKRSLRPKNRRLGGPHTVSWRCVVKDFCPRREYNCDSWVNKTKDKLYIFKAGFCVNSMRHRPFSDLAFSSDSQGNPGTSWNQKFHHRVQNNQPVVPILKQVNHGQTLRQYFRKINFNNILPIATSFSQCSSSFKFPNQNALHVSLLLVCATRFLPLINLI